MNRANEAAAVAAAAAYGAYFSRNGFIPKFTPTNTSPLSVESSAKPTSIMNINNKRTSNVLSSSIGTHSDLSDEDNDNELDEESFGK